MEPASGKANLNIFAMARKGLQDELPIAFRKALENHNNPIKVNNIKVMTNGSTEFVDIIVQQLAYPEALKGMVVIVFKVVPESRIPKTEKIKKGKTSSVYQKTLESELQHIKENLKSSLEEKQTSEEELKSTNEELQSTNEELQSTNEELTTSKEEMQSLNEEIQTVNLELQRKVDQFSLVESDMKNLLNSTDIATLFLNKNLCIRRFTTNVTKIFKMVQSDIDRPFTDLVTKLEYPDIADDARSVLQNLVYIEKTIPSNDGHWYLTRIIPYRTLEDRIDGLVMTFIDITRSKIMEIELRNNNDVFKELINSLSSAIMIVERDGRIVRINSEFEEFFGIKKNNAVGKNFIDLLVPDLYRNDARKEFQRILKDNLPAKFEQHFQLNDGKDRLIKWSVNKPFSENNDFKNVILIMQT